jgi:hypothetical protein
VKMLFVFSIIEALHIMNAPLEGQTNNIFIWRIYGMWYEESIRKCGLWEDGSFIVIMCLLTWYCQLDTSWQNIQFLPFHNPPYSLDFSLPGFFLFPKLRITLKRRNFQTVEDITNVTNDLKMILQTSFEHCFQKCKTW